MHWHASYASPHSIPMRLHSRACDGPYTAKPSAICTIHTHAGCDLANTCADQQQQSCTLAPQACGRSGERADQRTSMYNIFGSDAVARTRLNPGPAPGVLVAGMCMTVQRYNGASTCLPGHWGPWHTCDTCTTAGAFGCGLESFVHAQLACLRHSGMALHAATCFSSDATE